MVAGAPSYVLSNALKYWLLVGCELLRKAYNVWTLVLTLTRLTVCAIVLTKDVVRPIFIRTISIAPVLGILASILRDERTILKATRTGRLTRFA